MKARPSKHAATSTPAIPQPSRNEEQLLTRKPAPKKDAIFEDLHARITARAYELYLERGCRECCAEEDWLDAEREILNRTVPVEQSPANSADQSRS